jgi:hypothetical protein
MKRNRTEIKDLPQNAQVGPDEELEMEELSITETRNIFGGHTRLNRRGYDPYSGGDSLPTRSTT